MSNEDFEELSHNETYVGDVLQDNDGFLASCMSTHEKGKGFVSEVVPVLECNGQPSNECIVLPTCADSTRRKVLFK